MSSLSIPCQEVQDMFLLIVMDVAEVCFTEAALKQPQIIGTMPICLGLQGIRKNPMSAGQVSRNANGNSTDNLALVRVLSARGT